MAGKKKTNYISYELKKLDTYVGQLLDFLDKNPPNLAVDRLERIVTARGESIKVIASIEQQVKTFNDIMEKLPKLLEDLNRLRKEVDTDKKEIEVRGGQDRPGFMEDDDDIEEQDEKPKRKSNKSNISSNAFDDDSFHDNEEDQLEIVQEEDESEDEPIEQKQLPAPEDEEDPGDDSWLEERD